MQIHRSIETGRTLEFSGDSTSAILNYIVSDTPPGDQSEQVLQAVADFAPLKLGGAVRKKLRLNSVRKGGIYEVGVHYAMPERDEESSPLRRLPGDRRWSFEVKSSKCLITTGKELIRTIPGTDDTTPPDPGTLVCWDGSLAGTSEVKGVTALIPEITEECIATYRASAINANFRKKLFPLVGRINADPFRSWEPGDVLFMSMVQHDPYYNSSGTELVDITYRFGIRPATDHHFGQLKISGAAGWNALWSISRRNPADNSSALCAVYETRIYDSVNFSLLQL